MWILRDIFPFPAASFFPTTLVTGFLLRWVQINNKSSHTLRRVFLQDGLMWPSLGVLTLHVFLYKNMCPFMFLCTVPTWCSTFIYVYYLHFLVPTLPLYFLTGRCLRKVVNGVVPNNVRAESCLHPYDVRSLWWNAFINCVANLRYCTSMFYSQSFFIFFVLWCTTPSSSPSLLLRQ